MTKFIVIKKRHMQLAAAFAVLLLLTAIVWRWNSSAQPAEWNGSTQPTAAAGDVQVFEIVTGEFETRNKDGKMLEAYTWHPGSITVQRGKPVELRITGISGDSHPFVINGLGIKDEVVKGKTTIVRFTAEQAGTYEIRCLTHADTRSEGPMVGYIFVQ